MGLRIATIIAEGFIAVLRSNSEGEEVKRLKISCITYPLLQRKV